MRRPLLVCVLLLAIGAGLGIARYVRNQPAAGAAEFRGGQRLAPTAIAFRIMLGKGAAPTTWDGSVAITGGTLLKLEGWRFRRGDQVVPPNAWKAHTVGAVLPLGVVVTLQLSPPSVVPPSVKVTTAQGAFSFNPNDVTSAKPAGFLGGAVGVVRVAADFQLAATPTEDDFPAAAQAKDGTTWIAYVAYQYGVGDQPIMGNYTQQPPNFDSLVPHGNGDQVRLAQISADGTTFNDVTTITPPGQQDVSRPAIAVDNEGGAWVVWSQNVNNNWDLYARRYSNGALSPVERLTQAPEPDLAPALARDDNGTLWLAWQGFRNGQSDIFLRSLPNGAPQWSPPITVSDSQYNDWDPAIACAHDGSVYVAWDTYDKGDYDVRMRRVASGGLGPVIQVADTPDFEARASLACDAQNRVWVAYEEGSVNWGKDTGYQISQGSPLYVGHTVKVRVYVAGQPYHTAGDLSANFQAGTPQAQPRRRRGQPRAELEEEDASEIGLDAQNTPETQPGPQLVTASLQAGPQRRGRAGAGGQRRGRVGQGAQGTQGTEPGAQGTGAEPEPRALPAAVAQQQQFSFPRLGTDKSGRVYLTYRQTAGALRVRVGSTWISCVTTYDGSAWTPAQIVPDSDAVLDNRPAIVPVMNGQVALVHSSDARSHAFNTNPHYDLYYAPVSIQVGSAPPQLVPDGPSPPHTVSPQTLAERQAVARMRSYRAKIGNTTYQLVRGDFHRHTEISFDGGGDGPLVDMYRYAIDAASQDWICAGDHDYGIEREYTWWQIQKHDDLFHVGPQFVPLFGCERSVGLPNGHRNVMFVQRGIRPLPRLVVSGGGISPNDTKMLYAYLKQFNALCASHTSATTQFGTDWRDNDPVVEPIVEIYQGDRLNYESIIAGTPRPPNSPNPPGGYQAAGLISNAFAKGYKFGFESSSDHHSTHISYGIAYTESPTRPAIVDAFRKRHTYAATDNILVDVRDGSGNYMMGDTFPTKQAPQLHIRAQGTNNFARVIIIKNDVAVATLTPNAPTVDQVWTDMTARLGQSYYYVRFEQTDGQIAWASPMWITVIP